MPLSVLHDIKYLIALDKHVTSFLCIFYFPSEPRLPAKRNREMSSALSVLCVVRAHTGGVCLV